MSKVKECFGRKEKARHQLRRYETRHKKLTRASKYNNNEYMCCKGYWVKDETVHYKYEKKFVPAHYETYNRYMGLDYYAETGEWCKDITEYIPDRWVTVKTKEIIQPVFIVKQISTNMKYYKKFASRQFRRKKNFDEENYEVLKGSKYKRDYEILWNLW